LATTSLPTTSFAAFSRLTVKVKLMGAELQLQLADLKGTLKDRDWLARKVLWQASENHLEQEHPQ
jgi:hypothetical protein